MDLAAVREKKSRPGPASESPDSPTRDYVQIRNPNSAEADRPEREVNVKADLANLANVKADDTYVGGWSTPSSELASMSGNDSPTPPRPSLVAVPVPPKPKKTADEKIKKKSRCLEPGPESRPETEVNRINVSAILRAALDPQSLRDTQERIADLWFDELIAQRRA